MEELILEAQKGNDEAYTQLILQVKNDLYKVCKTRLVNEDDIDDAIQETMIQTFKQIKKLREPAKFKSWIITILINNCNNIYRKKQKFKLVNNLPEYEEYFRKEYQISDIEMTEDDLNFYSLIKHLKYEERIIIILYYSEKFTSKEIGGILHINENTVKTTLRRAKQKIKSNYEGGVEFGRIG